MSHSFTQHRTMWWSMKAALLGASLLTIAGCSLTPVQQANQVSIAPNTFVTLPTPADLGQTLSASQLITAQWPASPEKEAKDSADKHGSQPQNQQQLPVQLQVDSGKVALAGFSSWGSRILSLTYENNAIEASVLPGLGDTLPKPEQVLFNLMITLWPLDAWHGPLSQVGWQLVETQQHRQLIDNHGTVVADIRYQAADRLTGDIVFINHQLGYTIIIKTLQYSHTR